MTKLFSPPALLGFLYLNAALAVVVAASTAPGPEVLAFLASLPFAVGMVLVPFLLWRRLAFPRGLLKAAGLMTVPFFIAVILASQGTRQLVLLDRGPTVTGLSVAEAASHPGAVAFAFTDGRGRADLRGVAVNRHGNSSDTWHVVPFVTESWTPEQPVTAWAVHLGGVPQEVLSGQFRAGLLCDDRAERYRYARLAVRDAVKRHGLRSDPHAVILEVRASVADFKTNAVTFLVLAFGLVNLAWAAAALVCPPVTMREPVVEDSPTESLPLTPPMRDCLRAHAARGRRVVVLLTVGMGLLLFLLFGGMGAIQARTLQAFLVMGGLLGGTVWLPFALILWGIFLWFDRKGRRDLREGTYRRTYGPLRVESFSAGKGTAFALVLADRELLVDHRVAAKASGLPWGVVSYAPRGQFVFEVRDAAGRVVYRHPLYQRELAEWDAAAPGKLHPAVRRLADRPGMKIQAIKLHRELTGTGLAEAKNAVEAYMGGR
jgi:hypothetical protein